MKKYTKDDIYKMKVHEVLNLYYEAYCEMNDLLFKFKEEQELRNNIISRNMEGVPAYNTNKTNADRIRSISTDELANITLREMENPSYYGNVYFSSDGKLFMNKKQAIRHEIDWLNSECEAVE